MNFLPQELVDAISDYLDPVDFKQVLTVSKAFQHSAEKVFLRKFNLKENNADRFLRLYTGDRFQYLHHVRFLPTFPKLVCDKGKRTKWRENCRETPDDLLEKDTLFTRQIGFLFQTLKHLEDRVGCGKLAGKLRLTIYPPRRAIDWPCLHRTCICWRVHLLHSQTLPQLFSVRNLLLMEGDGVYNSYFDTIHGKHAADSFRSQAPSQLDLRILVDLASKLPSLERLDCSLNSYHWGMTMNHENTKHFTKDWAGPHRDARHDFARSLNSTVLPSSLNDVYLNLHRYPFREQDRDQRETLPDFVYPMCYDPFSTSLRVLSYQLERMVLRVIADETLFWPANGMTPHWPNLRIVDIRFISASPSGAWYFQGPQGEGYSTSPGYEITREHYEPLEENATDGKHDRLPSVYFTTASLQFRVIPIEETFRPFLASFAKAATCMPLLQKAMLWTNIEFCPEEAFPYYDDHPAEIEERFEDSSHRNNIFWGIAYAKPQEHIPLHGMGLECCAQRQLHWFLHDWQPDETLRSLYQGIGYREHGGEVIEHWASEKGHKWLSSSRHYDRRLEECSMLG